MQADADQNQRPEQHGEHRREYGGEAVQMHEVVVRVRDHYADDQIDDEENVAQHAALLAKGPRSLVEPESLGVACAIRRLGHTRRLPLSSAFPLWATTCLLYTSPSPRD